MKTKFIDHEITYTGIQLSPLYAYLNHKVLGNSIISFLGPCEVPSQLMIDGEDLLAGEKISGGSMLHFIIEVFDRELFTGVCLQRILASQIKDRLVNDHFRNGTYLGENKLGKRGNGTNSDRPIVRKGDDLFWGQGKMSISIASRSAISIQIHFAINITNEGTPVHTSSLHDLGVEEVRLFAEDVMREFAAEFGDIGFATQKVRPLDKL